MPFIPRRHKHGDSAASEKPSPATGEDDRDTAPVASERDSASADGDGSQSTTDTELDLPDQDPIQPVPAYTATGVATYSETDEQVEPASSTAPEEQDDDQSGGVEVVREPAPEGEEYEWHTGYRHPTDSPDAVEFIETHKAFGRNRILRGLNMGLPEGMISMILGPSGTGKSVCIKHMVGLLYPDEGDVLVHGESVPEMALDVLLEMRQKFGVLFQDGALFGSMDIYDNTAFPLRQHTDKAENEVKQVVDARLDEVGLAAASDKMPNELSGGMRKRAGFARALVLDPSIVLFDEPDSGLDPVRTALLGELIMEIHGEMMEERKKADHEHMPAFTLVTHDIMTARRVSQYINVLWKGRIVEAGPAEQLFNSENPFVQQFLAGESRGPLGMN